MIAPAEAVAAIPDGLSCDEAGPLLCAGITTYNSLRNAGARPGDLVAVLGIGGLGHLGIQYAPEMGFHTVAIGRGGDKEELVRKLGAHEDVDTNAGPPAATLQRLGGARVILATAPDSKAISGLVEGLGPTASLWWSEQARSRSRSLPINCLCGGSPFKAGRPGQPKTQKTRCSSVL